jgi:predicted amidohydrolase YtcJ
MESVDLKGVGSVQEAVRRVALHVATTPSGAWITGAGWDQNAWPGARFPTRHDLDEVSPEVPVVLNHTSAHCVWVNSAALRAAGVTQETLCPAGGVIDLDQHGEPVGILRDNASKLVMQVMPRPTQADRISSVERAIQHAHSLGLTGVHAMNVGRGEFQALHALNDSARLKLRVRLFLAHERLDEWIERNLASGDGDDMLRCGGVKFFSDGALGSLTAWMFEPYATSSDCGFPLQPVEELEADVRRCLEHGFAPAIHAIGDRANHEVLDLLERLRDVTPGLPRRVEHAQLLAKDDVPRFQQLRVAVSAQPVHATADWRKADREWGARGRGAYVFASLLRSGANLAFGSDTPVETMDPLAGVHAAVSRQAPEGEPSGGWYPDERLRLDEALRAYTTGPAVALGEGGTSGRIAAGCLADFVVLNEDPFSMSDPVELLRLRVQQTFVGGVSTYRRAPNPGSVVS